MKTDAPSPIPLHSLRELLEHLRSGGISHRELIEASLAQTKRWNPHLNAIIELDEEAVIAEAQVWDDRRARGESLPGLAGIPISIKDNLCTATGTTSCGSRMLKEFHSPYDSTVVSRLKQHGAVPFGKTKIGRAHV